MEVYVAKYVFNVNKLRKQFWGNYSCNLSSIKAASPGKQ